MTELRVDPAELTSGATGLQEAANGIPEPLAPFTSTGTDALSSILNTLTQSKEAPLAGMPATKADALANVDKILKAAGIYEQTDQQIADKIRAATEGLDPAAGGTPGGGGGAPAGGGGAPAAAGASPVAGAGSAGAGGAGAAGGGADQMQQMMSMPMQMGQQAAQMAQQVPQAVMQGVQGAVQQVSQLAGQFGKGGDSKADSSKGDGEEHQPVPAEDEKTDEQEKGRHAAPEGAAAGTNNAERAPESGQPKHAAPAPPAPPAEAAPVPPTGAAPGRSANSDPGIVL
ncbi:hypothetical protein CIW52_23780 [Mycolicibacterium sp. P9-64]|uniref:hypothetical protein n=1 Tax=Mycolicibacterium sp. P9-64 TaxID=2024612 RepID=UPI0011EEA5E3|nr:hypothetical protein [Mycolicibacterium sp. P9-64]KAA0080620.1 hypothetical protein CIW52_23780 [Mycolicibacterium sp. P9-64]